MIKSLRVQRLDLGLSQIELSEASRVPRFKIQLSERGIPCLSAAEADRILKKLGLYASTRPDWIQDLIESGSEQ